MLSTLFHQVKSLSPRKTFWPSAIVHPNDVPSNLKNKLHSKSHRQDLSWPLKGRKPKQKVILLMLQKSPHFCHHCFLEAGNLMSPYIIERNSLFSYIIYLNWWSQKKKKRKRHPSRIWKVLLLKFLNFNKKSETQNTTELTSTDSVPPIFPTPSLMQPAISLGCRAINARRSKDTHHVLC